jgi:hypothetical protein
MRSNGLLPRRFSLHRHVDVNGQSGVGIVATGLRLPLRLGAFMRWRTKTWSLVWYPRMEWVERVHGHEGQTTVVWREKNGGTE